MSLVANLTAVLPNRGKAILTASVDNVNIKRIILNGHDTYLDDHISYLYAATQIKCGNTSLPVSNDGTISFDNIIIDCGNATLEV